jgi:hypothetical protein
MGIQQLQPLLIGEFLALIRHQLTGVMASAVWILLRRLIECQGWIIVGIVPKV